MADTYGRLWSGDRKAVTRGGLKDYGISARLETWNGSIEVHLASDGMFRVSVGEKDNPKILAIRGDVDEKVVIAPDGSLWEGHKGVLIPAPKINVVFNG